MVEWVKSELAYYLSFLNVSSQSQTAHGHTVKRDRGQANKLFTRRLVIMNKFVVRSWFTTKIYYGQVGSLRTAIQVFFLFRIVLFLTVSTQNCTLAFLSQLLIRFSTTYLIVWIEFLSRFCYFRRFQVH